MLKINTKVKKYKISLIFACLGLGGIFLFQYLTFVPEYSSAEEISTDTPVTITPTTPLAKWKDLEYMQQMTPSACESASIGDSKTLTDSRDSSTYMVKKLSDSKCWMTDNLRIVDKSITSDDSDITLNYNIPASSIPWSSSVGIEGNMAHYANNITHGAYYSWFTATAGTGTSDITSGQASGSICPKGWKLPTSNSGGEFQTLDNKGHVKSGTFSSNGNINSGWWIGSSIINAVDAAFFTASGHIIGGGLIDVGSKGYYWSSTPNNSYAYVLAFDSNAVSSMSVYDRYNGYSVRCIAKTTSTETPVDPSESTGSGIINPNVSVAVDKILTMEIPNKEINIEPKTNDIATGEFSAKTSSNAGYDISLSTVEGGKTSLDNADNLASIPATNNVVAGTNGWGIKCTNATNCLDNNYHALTSNLQTYFTTRSGASNQFTNFEVGIGISPSLPSGTYSTNVLVTASQK